MKLLETIHYDRTILEELRQTPYVMDVCPTGSRVICEPPPTDENTDHDFLVYSPKRDQLLDVLKGRGYTVTLETPYQDLCQFVALRRGQINLIVTDNADYYADFLCATETARRLNLRDKTARIILFQAIVYGNPSWEPPVPKSQ